MKRYLNFRAIILSFFKNFNGLRRRILVDNGKFTDKFES